MTILEFFRTTRANLWLLIIGIVVGAAAGFGYASLQPKVYAASSSGYVTVGESGTVDVLSGSTAAKERARSYAAIVSSEAVAQKIKQNTPELSLTTGQIRSSITAAAGENAALITVSAKASSPKNAQLLANGALQATADYIKEIEQNPSNAQALVNGENTGATPTGGNTVRVIPLNNASVNPPLVAPNYQQNVLVGAATGLALVYLAIFLRRALDQRIRTRDDATKATGASILGVLPVSDDLSEENIVNGGTDDHIAQESIRQLRTNLRFVNVDTPPRSFIVTSAVPGEGKSTVSLSLARAMADAGSPVILIDADLRRPTVAKKLKLDAKVGLTQVLAGQVEIANAVHQLGDSNLFVLPAGRIPPNPSELLGSDKMRQLINELSEEFIVVVDVPPLLPVTDASLLSHSVDGVILVGSIGRSHREQMTEAASTLKKVNANLLGMVLNRAPRKGLGNSYYGFGYASAYVGYATYYGYGKEGDKKSSKKSSTKK